MRLGFACAWDPRPELTWSGTSWSLRAALRERAGAGTVVDVGIDYPPAVRLALKAACARRHDGRWVSMWRHSRAARRYGEAAVRRQVRRQDPDVVLQVQDLAVLDRPYLLFQDLSYDVLIEYAGHPGGLVNFPTLSQDAVRRLRDRQREVYAGAAGVLAMSRWFADHLVTVTGLPADRVHVVHPGASAFRNARPAPDGRPDDRSESDRLHRPRRRLLFVGRDFHRKGGEIAVAALAGLRREVDPAVTLTVVGPRVWPMPGPVPEGVRFLGALPANRVGALYAEHDLFVLPSRFEAFGIVFVEALSAGLPCVGRRAFAMPEIITPGRNGDLIGPGPDAARDRGGDGSADADAADVAELVAVVARLLADDAIYRSTAAAVPAVARHFRWERAADDVAGIAAEVARSAP
ncbi:MAG TPA: glycosyltransferase family 4 protein [Mycobacteriales bacterium]|nr:glycosyltransferase family 4 protein [Mycobacteriales bacterium]